MHENWWSSRLVLRKLREFRSFCTNAKVFQTTNKLQKKKKKKKIFCGNPSPNCTILCMTMYASSKDTHAKYAVAETHIPSVRQITVIPVLRNL